MKKALALLFFLITVLLYACQPQVRITEKEIVVTTIATQASTALPTHTPLPTHTALPTHTPYPTNIPTETQSISTNTPTATYTQAPDTIVVTINNGTRLRTGPGLIYDITKLLDAGQELTVIAKHAGVDDGLDWLLIETDALKAWIAERTINWVSGSVDTISVSDNIPSTPTTLPPTNTVLPPTNTVAPPTNTSIPPTAIPPTVAPPTNTPLPPATDIPLPTQQPEVCYCGGNTLNCGNFGSQSSAQACFNYCLSQGRGDIHRLDGDSDGDACESLP